MVVGESARAQALLLENVDPGALMARDSYDTLNAHLGRAPDLAHAVRPMGMLLAWCANMHMLSAEFVQQHERAVLRVRMQETPGSELLVAAGGDLRRDMFSAQGQRFLDDFYPRFLALYQSVLGADVYAAEDSWDNYGLLASRLAREYYDRTREAAQHPSAGVLGKIRHWFGR